MVTLAPCFSVIKKVHESHASGVQRGVPVAVEGGWSYLHLLLIWVKKKWVEPDPVFRRVEPGSGFSLKI